VHKTRYFTHLHKLLQFHTGEGNCQEKIYKASVQLGRFGLCR